VPLLSYGLGHVINGRIGVLQFLQGAPAIPIGGFCFFGPISLGFTHSWIREWRPVRIMALGDEVFVETLETSLCLPLRECLWSVVEGSFSDGLGSHRPRQALLLLEWRWKRRMGGHRHTPRIFACGFSPDAFAQWREFFIAKGVPRHRRPPGRGTSIVVFWLIGGIIGVMVGALLRGLLRMPDAPGDCFFVGCVDGGLVGLFWNWFRSTYRDEFLRWFWLPNGTLLMGLALAAAGFVMAKDPGGFWVAVPPLVNLALAAVFLVWIRGKAVDGEVPDSPQLEGDRQPFVDGSPT
jgi:hypothetical protein